MVALRVCLALVALLYASPSVQAQPTVEKLQITTSTGLHQFDVEVMRTRSDLEQGLMYRRYLAENHGMLFDFKTPQRVMMWMKNTYLPLDMVFIDARGKVINVAHHTEPMSETIIAAGGPTLGVLEVNAGTAEKIGLQPGDSVRASIFQR